MKSFFVLRLLLLSGPVCAEEIASGWMHSRPDDLDDCKFDKTPSLGQEVIALRLVLSIFIPDHLLRHRLLAVLGPA